jgi:hypothetical protein
LCLYCSLLTLAACLQKVEHAKSAQQGFEQTGWIRSPKRGKDARTVYHDSTTRTASQIENEKLTRSTALQIKHGSTNGRTASPAPYEPNLQMRSPCPHPCPSEHSCLSDRLQQDQRNWTKWEMEVSILEKERAQPDCMRAALQDATRVLNENRALKQKLACIERTLALYAQVCQYLYFCTRKANKLSTCAHAGRGGAERSSGHRLVTARRFS